MTKLISKEASPGHEAMYQALLEVLQRYEVEIGIHSQLGILSNIVGKYVAIQDQTRYTPDMIMQMVAENIQYGNQQVIAELDNPQGGTQ